MSNLPKGKLKEFSSLGDREFSDIVNYPFVESEFGVLSFLAEEKPLYFLGINACPAANYVPDLLLADLDRL